MIFQYKNKKFYGDGITVYSKRGIHIKVGNKTLSFKGWNDVRKFMFNLEEINREAISSNKRKKSGKDLILFPEGKEWIVWWKGDSITIGEELLKQLPIVLRFFLRRYHKMMLDFGSGTLKDGFMVRTNKAFFTRAMNNGLI